MFDVAQHLGAITRSVESTTRDGKPAKVVIASRTFATSPDDLWSAITDPERIPRWFATVEGDLRLGGRFQVQGNAGGEILACEAPRHLALTWEMGGGVSWVEVSLDGSDDSTTLTLRHTAEQVDTEFYDTYGPGAVGVGWELSLMGLDEHVSTGATMDHDQVEAWGATDDGRAFLSGSADGWGEAAVADGEDPTAARAAAAQTAAFYTGAEPPA
ncbi:SRPBCC family protein [Nocardioides hwasunensis]|uniref:SRPBCC family protein n=1 Tax=Nocardioides hwasunensis TaxID=397258 RepID=A0ABR8MLL4_9ACTN|nr:SRPBCC family protein [Nocardioides hwasunensis]MBD3916913.1 SRPBCC family protein [Nocardioides hwasunensis]